MKESMKTYTPQFYVDLTNTETAEDVIKAFSSAKESAGIKDDKDWLTDSSIIIVIPKEEANTEERKPWYKRFWNWITRKK